MGRFIALHPEVRDLRRGNEIHERFLHRKTSTQDGDDDRLFALDGLAVRTSNRRLDIDRRSGERTRCLIDFQKGDLAQCFTEDVAWRILVAQDRKLVRNERMIDHDQAVGVLLTYVLPLFHLVLQSTNVEAIPKTKLILVLGRRAPPLLL